MLIFKNGLPHFHNSQPDSGLDPLGSKIIFAYFWVQILTVPNTDPTERLRKCGSPI
jgi:hypothetical protein